MTPIVNRNWAGIGLIMGEISGPIGGHGMLPHFVHQLGCCRKYSEGGRFVSEMAGSYTALRVE